MNKLKELVEDFYEYTSTISITENELYGNYYDMISPIYRNMYEDKNILRKEIEKRIKADILYDFIYDIERIKFQIKNDLGTYEENTQEYKDIITMYNKIKKIFKNFELKKGE